MLPKNVWQYVVQIPRMSELGKVFVLLWPSDHFTWRTAARLTGCYGRVAVPPDVRKKTKASKLAADAIDALLALPVQRLLVAHADPIEDRPLEQLAEAWRFVRPG